MRILILTLLLAVGISTKAQITLEQIYSNQSGHFSLIKLQWSGYKYCTIDTCITLYNLNHSLFKQILFPSTTLWGANISYITEGLFNTDSSDIEYMASISDFFSSSTQIYSETGNLLLSVSGRVPMLISGGVPGTSSVQECIYNTDNGTKLIMGSYNGGYPVDAYVYSLPGSLECLPCSSHGAMSGWTDPSIEEFRLNAYPNPAGKQIKIDYQLPNDALTGNIRIYDASGNEVRKYAVTKAFDNILLPVSDFSSGVYYYALDISGKQSSAKKMIVVH